MRRLLIVPVFLAASASVAFAQTKTVTLPTPSPIVNIRIVFRTGAAMDPADKPGLANLTAAMLARGGTKDLTYKQIVDQMFPMAASVNDQVDQEMTTFYGSTHVDNLEAYYRLLHAMLLEPGWRDDDFKRVKDQATNALLVGLRGNNDEELGKEMLYINLYAGTPYGHNSLGTHRGIERITLDDVKAFYRQHYTQSNLIIGLAGGYPTAFPEHLKKDFTVLPEKDSSPALAVEPALIDHNRAEIVEKTSDSVAMSFGFPIDVKRGDPDYPALVVAMSYLGPHRLSSGRLFQRIREIRGLNYGDYAYVEYFPRGMFLSDPQPNLGRRSQIFQIWVRPVPPEAASFTLRLAMFELNHFVTDGIPAADFDGVKEFAMKYVSVLTKTKDAELGYAIDSSFYGIPDYDSYIRTQVSKLTRDQVNAAIRKHLRADRVQIVAIGSNGDGLKKQLTGEDPTTIKYNSPKAGDILEEDKTVEKFDLKLRPQDVAIVPIDKVLE